ncbi:MAG: methyltransferase domain-containing protein [Candidatus Woesearchaeota archaeon]|jgi:tRNA (adenine57-N1/adenine58-N1)-methyltransferase|nr:methyltransferase domain-containing protein [Candidatus Woesearchaeota archaeon]MDP7506537.1 methyltransferase domain-containing protein [Candidatus Woesearchaeota archaeon]MDP7610154.1 methyltransferase domain-containing protein [Candidatus Woesearchaeota archaeon]|tara:strand:- start:167 stop:904 length:738 start_codon:yes stop_codon:yes gene_type:complete
MIKKLLITDSGKRFFVKDLNADYHTQYGFIKKEDLKKAKEGTILTSNKGIDFKIFNPSFIDIYSKIKRGAQIIMPKDIGIIIGETGIGKTSKIIDAGSGSGALACFLANIAKEVITYEIRKDFHDLVKNNIESLGIKNIKQKNKDIYTSKVTEKNIDVIILDLPEPWKALDNITDALKIGGFLVTYSPCITSVMETIDSIKARKEFTYIKTLEALEREWHIDGKKVRPRSDMIAHTAFLSFIRKV